MTEDHPSPMEIQIGQSGWRRWRWPALIAIAAAFPLSQLIRAAVATITTPVDLEHCEGEVTLGICDARAGRALYPDALSSRVGLIYGPIYYWLNAPFTSCDSDRLFVGPRMVSLFFYALLFLILPFCVTRYRARDLPSWFTALGLTLFVALTLFRRLGSWYFLARVDAPALFFGTLAWAILRQTGPGLGGLVLAGIAQALAAGTKQSFLLQLPFLIGVSVRWPALSRENLRRALALGLPTLLLFAGLLIGAGYPLYDYMFIAPARHSLVHQIYKTFWTEDLFKTSLVEILITGIYLATLVRRKSWSELRFALGFLTPMILSAYASRVHSGGWINCIMPAVFALLSTAVHHVTEGLNGGGFARRAALVSLAVLLSTGLGRRWGYETVRVDPTSLRAQKAFVALASKYNVYFTDVPQINLLAGRYDPEFPLMLNWTEYFRGEGTPIQFDPSRLPRSVAKMERALGDRHFDFIVTAGFGPVVSADRVGFLAGVSTRTLCSNYRFAGQILYPNEQTMNPVVSGNFRPSLVLVRRDQDRALIQHFSARMPLDQNGQAAASEVLPHECLVD